MKNKITLEQINNIILENGYKKGKNVAIKNGASHADLLAWALVTDNEIPKFFIKQIIKTVNERKKHDSNCNV